MVQYAGPERRKHPRLNVNFVISYKIDETADIHDLTQSKNVSRGGMLLTTNRPFKKGTHLVMYIRFPFFPKKIEIVGEVVESKEVIKNLIYDTRIKFFGLEEKLLEALEEFVLKRLKYKDKNE